MNRGIVAIVGSPNVGKSSIFNRLVGNRVAIVDDARGITRDRLYQDAEWLGETYTIIDTGGIEIEDAPFQVSIRAQVDIAIEEADLILFVVDAQLGVTEDDKFVAKMLYKCGKEVILAVNKIDEGDKVNDIYDFYSLGIGEPMPVSGIHGIGIGDLLDKIIELLPKKSKKKYDDAVNFSLIGRPNVGKSSLVNAILGEDRVIVSPIEGTTRDAIDSFFKRDGQNYVVIDTAGLKKRGKIYESVDKYALLRAMAAIDRSNVVVLVIDAATGFVEQDKHVASYAFEKNKAMVIAVNKWDLIIKDEKTMAEYTEKLRAEFKFLDFANVVFTSALNRTRIKNIIDEIRCANISYGFRIPTSILNEIIADAQLMNPAPDFNGGRLKIYYASQVAIEPPTIVLFVNDPNYIHFSYLRYLENRLRNSYELQGSPLKIILRKKK